MTTTFATLNTRIDADLMEAVRIMSLALNVSVTSYVTEALEARVAEDMTENAHAYEAIRQARQKQQKGA